MQPNQKPKHPLIRKMTVIYFVFEQSKTKKAILFQRVTDE